MAVFFGFCTDRSELVPLPAKFFSELLPEISRASELKVTLHIFWRISLQKVFPKCVSLKELQDDENLLNGLSAVAPRKSANEELTEALNLAVSRGTVLRLKSQDEDRAEEWYFVNTASNRRLLNKWKRERVSLAAVLPERGFSPAARAQDERTSIFKLYEDNVGVLTPLIAEQLADAEHAYPSQWIEDAFAEAAGYNRRNWRYISRILENWATQGRQGATNRRNSGRPINPDKYRKGKYSHLFGRD